MKCIFCDNELDQSDEHIIPESLNGRIHSKNIVCSICNSKVFGRYLDPVAKEFFNPLLIAFEFKNARGMYLYSADGEQFLHTKEGSITQVRPRVIKSNLNSKGILEVQGDPKNAIKLFKKEYDKLQKEGKVSKKVEIRQLASDGAPFKSERVFELKNEFRVIFNKIAFEYLSFKEIDITQYKSLLLKVRNLDVTIENVRICNINEEIRKTKMKELTHIIKPIVIQNKLIVYIELFNILCAAVLIDDNYSGMIVSDQYYQDAVSGARLEDNLELNEEELLMKFNQSQDDPSLLNLNSPIQRAFGVLQEIELSKRMEEVMEEPIRELEEKLKNGHISEKEYHEQMQLKIIEEIAKLSVNEFPYMFDDINDEMDNRIHYRHSNLREEQYEEFCQKNGHLIGKIIVDPENKRFEIKGFENYPLKIKNGISIVKVMVVVDGESGRYRLPYKDVFEMEPVNEV